MKSTIKGHMVSQIHFIKPTTGGSVAKGFHFKEHIQNLLVPDLLLRHRFPCRIQNRVFALTKPEDSRMNPFQGLRRNRNPCIRIHNLISFGHKMTQRANVEGPDGFLRISKGEEKGKRNGSQRIQAVDFCLIRCKISAVCCRALAKEALALRQSPPDSLNQKNGFGSRASQHRIRKSLLGLQIPGWILEVTRAVISMSR